MNRIKTFLLLGAFISYLSNDLHAQQSAKIVIATNAEKGNAVWLQKVTDKEYSGR